MAEIIIKAENLTKKYDTATALSGVSFCIESGEFVAIEGESGSGKSTLLYLLAGIEIPSSGNIFYCGRQLSKLSEKELAELRRKDIGFIYQFYNLLPDLSAKDNVMLPLFLDNNTKLCNEKALQYLEYVGMSEKADCFPAEMSGGEQQRVAIARALIAKPKVLFADELTGNLDSKSATSVMELLKRIHQDYKTTIVMVTHTEKCSRYADRKLLINDGIIIDDTKVC